MGKGLRPTALYGRGYPRVFGANGQLPVPAAPTEAQLVLLPRPMHGQG